MSIDSRSRWRRPPLWPMARLPYRAGRALVWTGIDRALNVETTPPLRASDFNPYRERPADWAHIPTGWFRLWRIFRQLRIRPDDVLYDVGSGSGRPLLVASRFPFRRMVGIERSAPMQALAARNLKRFRPGVRMPATVVHGDALSEPVPDDVSIVFFYNPFEGEIAGRFFTHLLACVDKAPRPLRFVYHNPVEHGLVMATGRFRLTGRLGGMRPTRNWARMVTTHFYEIRPAARVGGPLAGQDGPTGISSA